MAAEIAAEIATTLLSTYIYCYIWHRKVHKQYVYMYTNVVLHCNCQPQNNFSALNITLKPALFKLPNHTVRREVFFKLLLFQEKWKCFNWSAMNIWWRKWQNKGALLIYVQYWPVMTIPNILKGQQHYITNHLFWEPISWSRFLSFSGVNFEFL